MSNVTPQSTTANLAANVPKESSRAQNPGSSTIPGAGLPGAFPQTPANEATGFSVGPEGQNSPSIEPPGAFPETPANEATRFSVDPIPATAGVGNPINLRPGEKVPDPSTLTSNTISSTVHDDHSLATTAQDLPKAFGVSPLPATSGIGNPIQTKPGENLPEPSTYTRNTINSAVTTDKESYERSSGPPQLPDVVTPQTERDANGGMFNLPGITGNMIPESSLPLGFGNSSEPDPGVTIQSAGANSSTAALAGQVPLQPRSVRRGEGPSEQSSDPTIQSAGENSSTAALAGQVPLEPRNTPKDANWTRQGVDPTIQSVGANSTTADLAGKVPLEPRSMPKGHGSSSQGSDPTIQSVGANSTTADLAGQVPLEPRSVRRGEVSSEQGSSPIIQSAGAKSTTAGLAGDVPLQPRGVPDVVQNSQHEAGFPPEASANAEAVREKTEVEKELESKVAEEPAASEGIGGQSTNSNVGIGSAGKSTAGTTSLPSRGLPTSIQQSIDEINTNSRGTAIAPTVPDVVQKSITASHQSPEAAASRIVVDEKYTFERELLQEVKPTNAVGEPAPSSSAALTDSAPSSTNVVGKSAPSSNGALTGSIPNATNITATGAPTVATPPTRALEPEAHHTSRLDSRDISPMSRPINPTQDQPTITTGVGSSTAPKISQPAPSTQQPVPSASSSPKSVQTTTTTASASTDKKSKRASGFFGKLKQKFSDKKSAS